MAGSGTGLFASFREALLPQLLLLGSATAGHRQRFRALRGLRLEPSIARGPATLTITFIVIASPQVQAKYGGNVLISRRSLTRDTLGLRLKQHNPRTVVPSPRMATMRTGFYTHACNDDAKIEMARWHQPVAVVPLRVCLFLSKKSTVLALPRQLRIGGYGSRRRVVLPDAEVQLPENLCSSPTSPWSAVALR